MTTENNKNDKMSKAFTEQEEKNKAIAASKPLEQETVYFVSKASKCRIGNFREESRSHTGDRVLAREKAIEFENNMRPVGKYDLKTRELSDEYVFLKESNALASGDIFEFENKKEALQKIRSMEAVKLGQKNIEIEDVQVDQIEFGANALKVNKVSTSATG